ncbi:MAG: hypothetical protein IKJ88_08205 [Clostridia bacterium]|nr:hypothetical protein [Clostridia bacterium]MBR3975826.1 hypothetical protein [Clostridia bacterium]
MLQTLIQTIANLGFDAQAVEATFNEIIATIQTGDMTSLEGVGNVLSGLLSIFTGINAGDISVVISSLVSSVVELLSNDATSSFLTTITGA